MKNQLDIFFAFFRIGMFGYGGGLTMLPVFFREVVEKYQWITNEEFSDILAMGNVLPGPIIVKIAGYIGYRVGGLWGCINAIVAMISFNVILMIVSVTFLFQNESQSWIGGVGKGVTPVIGAMLGSLTWKFLRECKEKMGWESTFFFSGISVVVILYFHFHPAWVIISILAFAVMNPLFLMKFNRKKDPK